MRLDVLTTQTYCEELLDLAPLSSTEEKRFCRAKFVSDLEHVFERVVRLAKSKLHHDDFLKKYSKCERSWFVPANAELSGKSADFFIIDDMINFPLTSTE